MSTRAEGSEVFARATVTDSGQWRLAIAGEKETLHANLGDAKRHGTCVHVLPLTWEHVDFHSEWVAYPADLELLEQVYRSDGD